MGTFAELYQHPVPSAPEAEMALLGSLILAPGCMADVAAILPPGGGFYDERHIAIYRSLCRLYAVDPDADLVDLAADLRARGEFEAIGHDYIDALANGTPSAAGAGRYAKVVADHARRRRLIEACDRAMYDAFHEHDGEAVCSRAVEAVSAAVADAGRLQDVSIRAATAGVLASIQAGVVQTIPTGLFDFDAAFGGIPAVGVTTVLGVPGSGKSSLAAQIIVGSGIPFRVFSFEMTAERIAENLIASRAQVDMSEVRRRPGAVATHSRANIAQSVAELDRMDIGFIEDNLPAPAIRNRCAMYAAQGVKGFLIDYAQNVAPSYPSQDERERVSEVMRTAQQISRQFKACVIVVSQPTQEAGRTNRPPLPSDGKGAQELWAASDMMLGVYRPAVFEPKTTADTEESWDTRRQHAQIHVLKNKHGRVGYVNARFTPEHTRFE